MKKDDDIHAAKARMFDQLALLFKALTELATVATKQIVTKGE